MSHVELVLGTDMIGSSLGWSDPAQLVINAPILDFTISAFLDDVFRGKVEAILRSWAEIDSDNIARVSSSVPILRVPHLYTTNELPWQSDVTYLPVTSTVRDDLFEQSMTRFEDALGFVGGELFRRQDAKGTALAMFLFRHLFSSHLFPFPKEANQCWAMPGKVAVNVEELEKRLKEAMAKASAPEQDSRTLE
jgi:hypothetical protein